jgi:multidrug efflux pump subunit AcrA (membrane-fusion protein)
MRRDKPARPWHLYLLGVVAIVIAVLAATQIGPPGTSARTSREIVTAENGIVQSTVTGTGNVEAGTDVDVNFQTSGTLSQVFVSQGQHVNQGQLLATLDSTSAQLSVDQAQEALTAAEDQLTEVENGTASGSSGGSGGSGGGSGSSGSSGSGQTASLQTSAAPSTEFVSLVNATRKSSKPSKPSKPTTPTRTTTTPTRPSAPSTSGTGASRSGSGSSTASTRTTTTPTTTTTTPLPSSIASAQASVYQAEANLHTAQQAMTKTSLYAPVSGTIVSLASLSPGDPVTAGNSGNASSGSSSSSGGSGSSGSGAGGSSTSGSLGGASTGSSSSSGSGSGSSTPFAQIVDTGSLTMTVAFSESDISKVAVGQAATVTMDALSGVELAAHVSSISTVGTSSSGVVSYDATLTLDQTDPRVKPGMSASAAVITGQAQGVTVPNQAVTGSGSLGTVNVLQNGKTVAQQVIVGLRGDTRTQIVSGLNSGQQLVVTIVLPALSTQSSSTTPSTGTLGGGGRFGGGGLGGGGLGGGGAFFRGGGGGGAAAGGSGGG